MPHKHPTTYILTKNILDNTFYGRVIAEADLNKCEPWDLLGTCIWRITIIAYYIIHNFNNISFIFLILQEKEIWYCKYYDITHVQQRLGAHISSRITIVIRVVRYQQRNYNWYNEPSTFSQFELIHTYTCMSSNIWDKHMNIGRIN